jgi:hypothetical protein
MKKAAILSTLILLVSFLIKYGVEAYVSRAPDYPDGPTVNADNLYTDYATSTFYKSANMSQDSLFTGTSVRYHVNGEMLAKAGIKNGKLHGPFDSWYENGQKHISLVWNNGEKFKNFKAYFPSGNRIPGDPQQLAERIFSGEIIEE